MFQQDELVTRALLVLEAVLCETEKRPVPRTLALRFTLAYLYAVARRDRPCFDSFWREVTDDTPCENGGEGVRALGRSANANAALNGLYRAVGMKRTNDMMFKGPREATSPSNVPTARGRT